MKVKISKLDRFIDWVMGKHSEDPEWSGETRRDVEELKAAGFWSKSELDKAVFEWCCQDYGKLMRKLPKHDENGDDLEHVHVARSTEEGTQDLYIQRLSLTYDDRVQRIEYNLQRGKHFYQEARRLYDLSLSELPKKEATSLRSHFRNNRLFQGLLEIEGIEEDD